MVEKNYDLKEFDFANLIPKGFVNEVKLETSIKMLEEITKYVVELIDIRDTNPDIPEIYKSRITSYENKIIEFLRNIEQVMNGEPDIVSRTKNKYLNDIQEFHRMAFNIDNRASSNKVSFIEYYSIIKSINDNNELFKQKAKNFQKEIDKIKTSSDDKVMALKENLEISNELINELQKKTSEEVVSDYAIVFNQEATTNEKNADKWKITGIVLSIILVVSFILDCIFHFIPTEIFDEQGKFIRYNFTNLVSKLIIIAIQVFLISFSFKQYNVNKHLRTLNIHRKNALNSYKLFTNSIGKDDINSRNTLMIQVAKAIYEYSQSTGYLNEKNQNVSPGILELTKIIGTNNPTS